MFLDIIRLQVKPTQLGPIEDGDRILSPKRYVLKNKQGDVFR
jgi:hypothetical protein